MKKLISIILMFSMLFILSSMCFADDRCYLDKDLVYNSMEDKEVLNKEIKNPFVENFSFFTVDEIESIKSIILNPRLYLKTALIDETGIVLLYSLNENVGISITNGYLEVIEKVGENTFLINGRETHLYDDVQENTNAYLASSASVIGEWVETSSLSKQWVYDHYYWHNLHFDNLIMNYTLGTLAYLIGVAVGGISGGFFGIASFILSSPYTNTSTAAVEIYTYYDTTSMPNLIWYRKDNCYGYAYNEYNGQYQYLGVETKYYFMNLR